MTIEIAAYVAGCLLAFAAACGGSDKPDTATVVKVAIDCTIANRAEVESLLAEFMPLLQGDSPNWQQVIDKATAAGKVIGGCALAELAQRPAAPEAVSRSTSGATPPGARSARAVFEQWRADQGGGAVYNTRRGPL